MQRRFVGNVFGKRLNLAVLDSGGTKTMFKKELLKCYLDNIIDLEDKKTQNFASNIGFRFGDRKSAVLEKSMLIPEKIADKAVTIKNVVKSKYHYCSVKAVCNRSYHSMK